MSNYQAIVAKVDSVFAIPNADNIQGAKVLGETVVVSKSVEVGYVGVLFLCGTQLSEQYCHENNLLRDSSKNKDVTKSGFFETSRRVRAQPFLKVRSEGYFADISSLEYTGFDLSKLKLGDKFEELNDVKICTKYINENAKKAKGDTSQGKTSKKHLTPYFLEHVETSQFKHNMHLIEKGDLVSIQSKKHGTSQRVGYTKKIIPLTGFKKFVNKFIPVFQTETYEYVVGTRRVVLDSATNNGFHGSEEYRFKILEELKPYLTKGMEIYLEVVGYANGRPIMSNHSTKDLKDKSVSKKYGDEIVYKYGAVEGECKFHIYRITLTTEDGTGVDLTQQQLVKWCWDRGLTPAYDLVEHFIYDGDQEKLASLVEELTERPDFLTEDYHDPSQISEGVIVRVDRGTNTPLFLKNKSYLFKVMEGIASEKEVDVEDIS